MAQWKQVETPSSSWITQKAIVDTDTCTLALWIFTSLCSQAVLFWIHAWRKLIFRTALCGKQWMLFAWTFLQWKKGNCGFVLNQGMVSGSSCVKRIPQISVYILRECYHSTDVLAKSCSRVNIGELNFGTQLLPCRGWAENLSDIWQAVCQKTQFLKWVIFITADSSVASTAKKMRSRKLIPINHLLLWHGSRIFHGGRPIKGRQSLRGSDCNLYPRKFPDWVCFAAWQLLWLWKQSWSQRVNVVLSGGFLCEGTPCVLVKPTAIGGHHKTAPSI